MDPLELQYDSLNVVPEAFRGLYTERDGKAVLTGINGMKTQGDVDTVKEALRKERENHATTQNLLKPWNGLKADEVLPKLSRIAELEEAAKGKIDDTKIEEIVGNRLKLKTGPLETQLNELTNTVKTKDEQIASLQGQLTSRMLKDIVVDAATKSKVHATAIPDVEFAAQAMMAFDETGKLVTKDGLAGIPAGLSMDEFLKVMFKQRPHWWPDSEGGGSKGGQGGGFGNKNPWSKDHWNMTEQGKFLNEHGREAADRLARAAGVTVGATGPKA